MIDRPFAIHLSALTLTKTADGLIDPKLVLAWLLNAIGAPGYAVGMLVPVRESGALLPQLPLARGIERIGIRKYVWAGGSAMQGAAALGMALSAILLSGAAAGWAILGCLAVLAIARSACSASYKDILARTVEKGRRGKVSGSAGTVGGIAVLGFALLLSMGIIPREPAAISAAIALAGVLWFVAALIFLTLKEPEDTEPADADEPLSRLLDPLQSDPEFRTYVATRGLMISTALAPPFLVMLGSSGAEFGNLGLLILASSIAAIVSSFLWGALSDRSSRQSLMIAGGLSAVILALAAITGFLSGGGVGSVLVAGYVFVAQIAYEGARAGRKTHLTDMDSGGRKPVYTALSNTLIGVLLIIGGVFGIIADYAGPETVLGLLALLSLAGVVSAYQLSEVQSEPG